jgi:hypothetical protein
MAFDITKFRSSLTSDVANPTNYEVEIYKEPDTLLTEGYEFPKIIKFRCETCALPAKNMKSVDRMTYGPVRRVAYSADYTPVTFSFIATDSMKEKEYFEIWQRSIVDNTESADSTIHDVAYYDDYIGEIWIKYYDKSGRNTYLTKLKEAYPISVQETPLSWNSNNEYIRITVTMMYRLFEEERIPHPDFTTIPFRFPVEPTVEDEGEPAVKILRT